MNKVQAWAWWKAGGFNVDVRTPQPGFVEVVVFGEVDRARVNIYAPSFFDALPTGVAASVRLAHTGETIPGLKGQIMLIALDVMDAYGVALGAGRFEIVDPEPALVPRYKAAGFLNVAQRKSRTYLWR